MILQKLKNQEQGQEDPGPPRISYSELKNWKECPYRHKLTYIDKLSVDEPSPYLSYGTAVHAALEEFLKTKKMDVSIALEEIKSEWAKHGFDSEEWIKSQADYRASQGWRPKAHNYLSEWLEWAENCLNEIPDFLNNEFDEWETVSAEEELYEFVEGYDIFFKGFIDALLKVKIKNKEYYYVLDWKTAGAWGWKRDKKVVNFKDTLSNAPHQIFNIGNSKKIKLMDFIEELEKCFNIKADKKFLEIQPGDVESTFADCSKLEKYIDFKPNTKLSDGINKFANWCKEYY